MLGGRLVVSFDGKVRFDRLYQRLTGYSSL